MKLKIFAALAAVLFVTASCGILGTGAAADGTAADNNGGAVAAGTSLGAALAGLYTQYKTDGKIDLTNLTNIINIATILNGVKNGNTANSFADSEFINGLVAGSKNLVNKANSSKIANSLSSLANIDYSAIASAAKKAAKGTEQAAQQAVDKVASSEQVTAAVTALSSILKTLK